jgi:hypothetical protein
VHRHFANFDELAPILKRLVQHGWLRYADVPPTGERGRRPEALYEIHPNFGGFVSPSVTKTTDTLNHDATRS